MSARRPRASRLLAALLPALLAAALGCASLPRHRQPSEVPTSKLEPGGRLQQLVERLWAGRGQHESGFGLLADGESALLTRLSLVDLATSTLDLQYYLWDLDASGRLLLSRALAAADRGVRVRVLLDDTAVQAHEAEWAALDLHPRVEVRSFNPFLWGRGPSIGQAVEFLLDFGRLNRRMHNKAVVADGVFALVGGRNVADDYFALDSPASFRDLDLLAAGPIAGEAAAAFERFWYSTWASPLPPLRTRRARASDLEALRQRLAGAATHLRRFPYRIDLSRAARHADLSRRAHELVWASGQVLADAPQKVGGEVVADTASRKLFAALSAARREILAEVAYLVPPRGGLDLLRELDGRGVRMRILTNSLATNDVIAAHAGYANSRPSLLDAGVELHELRPDGGPRRDAHRGAMPSASQASLHSKTVVIDGERLYVGSLNLDGRSIFYNTEIGMLVESPELARRAAAILDAGCAPGSSWRVARRESVEPATAGSARGRKLVWIEIRPDGRTRLRHREPKAGPWRRLQAFLYARLPIDRHL